AVETTIFSGSSGGVNRSTIFTTGSMLSLGAGGSTRMSILSNGNVGIGMTDPSVALDVTGDIEYTGTITDVSDIRLKENIKPIDGALDKLLTLDGVSFNMIGDDRRNLGFIAQEVQKVFPEAISVMDGAGHLGLDYTQMIPPIIEGIKELKAENESLKARIELLEAKQ
ncbi:MAG: tail fiber domain-containing protein, partial [Patescibacteria group bacterium]